MSDKLFLSIIIPAFNAEDTIDRCIRSCIQKTTFFYEIIVVNDGSTDDTELYIQKIKNNHDNIILISQNNKGVSAARNVGLKAAKAEHIIFVDADDELINGALQTIFDDYQVHKPDFLSYYFENDKLNGVKDLHFLSNDYYSENVKKQWLLKKFFYNADKITFSSPCCRLYDKKIISENNIHFNELLCMGEDRVFNDDYVRYIDSFEYVDKCIYIRHIVSGSLTHTFSTDRLKDYLNYFKTIKVHSEEFKKMGIDIDSEYRLRIVLDSFAALKSCIFLNDSLSRKEKRKTALDFLSSKDITDAVNGLNYCYGLKDNLKIFLLKKRWVDVIPILFRR